MLTNDARHVRAGFLFNFLKQDRAGFFAAHFGHALKLGKTLIVEGFDLVGSFVDSALSLVERRFPLLHLVKAVIQLFTPLHKAVIFLDKFTALVLNFALRLQGDLQGGIFGFEFSILGIFFSLVDDRFGGSFKLLVLAFADG